jgi:hypothetical protein
MRFTSDSVTKLLYIIDAESVICVVTMPCNIQYVYSLNTTSINLRAEEEILN